jgi:hypothetical protein
MGTDTIGMARVVWNMAKGALPAVLVATLIPMALFYIALTAGSVGWAIAVSVGYAYSVAAYQFARRRRVSGMLIVTAFMATVRALAAVLSHKVAFYFAVPIVETAGFGLMFLATMFSAEPLVVRLARDLVPGAADGLAERRSLIRTLSLIWTVTYLGSGATTLALLVSVPLPVYLGAHTLTGWVWTGSGVLASLLICRSHASGLLSCLTGRTAPLAASAKAPLAAAAAA